MEPPALISGPAVGGLSRVTGKTRTSNQGLNTVVLLRLVTQGVKRSLDRLNSSLNHP